MSNVTNLATHREWGQRKAEIVERNQRNYSRWYIKWLEYSAMVEYEGADFSPYHLMTGR